MSQPPQSQFGFGESLVPEKVTEASLADPRLHKVLRTTATFVRGFVILGGASLAFQVVGTLAAARGNRAGSPAVASSVATFAFYLIPLVFLWQYAAAIRDFLASPSELKLAVALTKQKSFWKFIGGTMLFIVVLMAVLAVTASFLSVQK